MNFLSYSEGSLPKNIALPTPYFLGSYELTHEYIVKWGIEPNRR